MRTHHSLYLIYDNYFLSSSSSSSASVSVNSMQFNERSWKKITIKNLWATIEVYKSTSKLHENDNSDMDNKQKYSVRNGTMYEREALKIHFIQTKGIFLPQLFLSKKKKKWSERSSYIARACLCLQSTYTCVSVCVSRKTSTKRFNREVGSRENKRSKRGM